MDRETLLINAREDGKLVRKLSYQFCCGVEYIVGQRI